MSPRSTRYAGLVAILGFIALVIWRLYSNEAKVTKLPRKVHTHTVTFTCDQTCTDTTLIPEVFPWRQ